MQSVDTNQSLMSCTFSELPVEFKPLQPPPPPRSLSTPLNSPPFVKPLFVLPRQDSGRRFSTGTGNLVYVNVKRSRVSSDGSLPQYTEEDSTCNTSVRTTVRASESGNRPSLPQWSEESKDAGSIRVSVRATDSGKGFILPLTITPPPPAMTLAPPRRRTASSPSVKKESQSASDSNIIQAVPPPPPPGVQSRSNSDASSSSSSSSPAPDESTFADPTDRSGRLRRRTVHASEGDMSGQKESRERSARSPSPKPTSRREKMGGVMMTFLHLLQVIAIFTIFCLVYDSHSKMNMAAVRLKDYKDGFLTFGMETVSDHANTLELHQQRLLQIGDELHRTIRTIQKQVQDTARQQIVDTFGEGPVQVALDLEFFTEGPSRIIIQFFEETPHTAWNWLEQVSRQAWDGAQFMWHAPHVIQAVPPKPDEAPATFNFTEIAPGNHQTYTVGLTKASSGALNIYINLQDNSAHHFEDACVGKVVDGFDALKRLLEAPQTNSALDHPVTIKSVTALPRQQALPAGGENAANSQAEVHVS